MKTMRTLLLSCLLALVVTACGPSIETRYSYRPPSTNAGMACIQQCEQNRMYCQSSQQVAYQNCRAESMRRAEYEYRAYLHTLKRGEKPKRSISSFDNSYMCGNREWECKSAYNDCYSACGGQVTAQRICVADCDQLKPPVPPYSPVGPALVNGVPVANARPQSTAPRVPLTAASPGAESVEVRSLASRYRVRGTNSDGSTYSGTVALTRDGSRYRVTWDIDGERYRGVGTLSGNRLLVESTTDGEVTRSEMVVSPTGTLSGPWTVDDDPEDSGTEEWTPS
ncbi:MAG TPA: hypothetical protein VGE72_08395 [Azospirillum sp.]